MKVMTQCVFWEEHGKKNCMEILKLIRVTAIVDIRMFDYDIPRLTGGIRFYCLVAEAACYQSGNILYANPCPVELINRNHFLKWQAGRDRGVS
jgi:hypothetical protein